MGVLASSVAADLVGNWSWTVWLLIPVTLVLALVTAIALGPRSEPDRTVRGSGGVSRYLERQAESADRP